MSESTTRSLPGSPPDPRVLGTSWEGVVRGHGLTEGSAVGLARRFLETWQGNGGPWLEVEATRILVDGQPVLEASATQGAWILPAFTTGIRCFRPLQDAQAVQVRAFGDELARLRPSVAAITRFRDWLWADGAEGMDVQIQASFLEAGETEVMAEAERWIAQRPRRAQSGNRRGVLLYADDLARAGEPGAAPVPARAGRSAAQNSWRDLGATCDDGGTWGRTVVGAMQASTEMQALMPPARLAQFVRQLLLGDPDVDLMVQLLSAGGDGTSTGFVTAMDLPDLGMTIARQIPGTPAGLQSMIRLGRLAPLGLLGGIARGLRERANGPGRAWVVDAVSGIGAERLCAHVQLEGLAASEILAWSEVLAAAGAPPEAFGPVLKSLSAPDAVRLAQTFRTATLGALAGALAPALARAPAELAIPVLFKLSASGLAAAAIVAGDTLIHTRGAGWPPQLVIAVCHGLGQHNAQRPLAALTRDTDVDFRLRVRILNLLTDPDAVAAATVASLWDYMEPGELKLARRALRERARK